MKKSILQTEKECFITGSKSDLHLHHIYFGAGRRKISDENGFTVYLRSDWHNMADYGVHFNKSLDLSLKQICQKKYEETHAREEFIALVGKSYL